MRIVAFSDGSDEPDAPGQPGLLVEGTVVALADIRGCGDITRLEVARHVSDVSAAVAGRDLRRLPSHPLDQVRLRCPFVPRNVYGTGTNYVDHLAEMGGSAPAVPTANFLKLPGSVAGPGDPVVAPAEGFLDYEAEIAVLIGRATGPGDDVDGAVAGLLLANDLTARDAPTTHLTLAKSGPGYCPLGPALVTLDEVDPHDVSFELCVNGEVRQRAHTSGMVHSIEAVVASYARALRLHPGDVVLTGSPGGVGVSLDPPRRLEPGDLVVVRSPQLGELATPIVG